VIAVLGLHALAAVLSPWLARRLGRRVLLVGALAPAAALGYAIAVAPGVLAGSAVTFRQQWIPGMALEFGLQIDAMALLMIGVISLMGVLVMVYSHGYLGATANPGRFSATLLAFSASMLGLVSADDVLLLFVFWELTSITSYLLIGFEDHRAEARSSALQALLVTGLGGLAMLAGLVLLTQAAGTGALSEILAAPPATTAAGVGLVLVLLGAFSKSAQVPFHFWLPGAMAAPTPVSAFLHSATMVKAGVYLIARLAPAFALVFSYWQPLVVGIGVATMLVGGYQALRQTDLKLLLAHGTVSQLGFLTAMFGAGVPAMTVAAVVLLVAHALFKAALFLVVGIVDHEFHTRDIRRLHRVGRRMPGLAAAAVLGVASMAGLPLLFGFIAKEEAWGSLLDWDSPWGPLTLAGVVMGSALTAAYGLRFVVGGFFAAADDADGEGGRAARVAASLALPVAVPLALTVGLGSFPFLADSLVGGASTSLVGAPTDVHLAIWHGWEPALGLSALALGMGALLWRFLGRRPLLRLAPSMSHLYGAGLRGVNHLANRVTGIVQNGSLSAYIGVILATTVGLAGWRLVPAWRFPAGLVPASSVVQATVAGLVIAGAIGTARANRRMAAVLWLGTVGYSVGVLMVLQGAPDLALTQMLVETMLVAIFVLVLRHLPPRFDRVGWRLRQASRVTISIVLGVFAAGFALAASAAAPSREVAEEMVARALPDGGGRNVVNVILTDFRALDTLGEITVLVVAALGVLALIRSQASGKDER
jgi:multicomponent Na+:H+ antiporter subunit A